MNKTTPHEQKRYNHFFLWAINHLRALTAMLGQLIRAPLATIMTVSVIGVAMALPVGLYLLLQNFEALSKPWNGRPTVTLYLQQTVSPTQMSALIAGLKQRPDVADVRYISPAEGLREFKQAAAYGDILDTLSTNPLPPVLVVNPPKHLASPQALQQLVKNLRVLPNVETATLDLAWIKRLFNILTLGKRVTYALAFLFGIGVILIIGNTIRLITQSHRQEMNILKLVGATHAFIRRPLLYRGFLYGFLGGRLAWLLVSFLLWWLTIPAEELAASYGNQFRVMGLSGKTGIEIILFSALLGLLGAWLASQRHLISPENL